MIKYIRFLFVIFIIIALNISYSYSQSVEVQGFIPNKGQFGKIEDGNGILGRFCGAIFDYDNQYYSKAKVSGVDSWLTDKGIDSRYYFYNPRTDAIVYSTHKIRVLGSNPIKLDSIEFYDSSNNVINYYLPNTPEGILNIRGYKKIVIKSILDNVDWEINYQGSNTIFTHRFILKQTATPKTEIVLHTTDINNTLYKHYRVDPNSPLYFLHDINIKDTLTEDIVYPLFKYLTLSPLIDDKAIEKPVSNIYWFTKYGVSNYFENFWYDNYKNFDNYNTNLNNIAEITSSATDINGNLYTTGKMCMINIPYKYDSLSNDSLSNLTDAFISKFNKDGVLLWTTIYGSSANDEIGAIEISSNNFLYASGYIDMHFLEDGLRKSAINNNHHTANTLWENDFPLQQQPNSFFSVDGSLFILKFDTNGIRQWATLLGKDYGIITDNGRERPFIIDCEITSSTINSKDDIYFSGTYRPSIYRENTTDKLPSIDKIETLSSLPIEGGETDSTWTMEDINSRSANRFSGSNQWNSYPFILKIDSSDKLVWSTYFFSTQPILAMEVDSKDNLYIGGNTTDGNLPTKYKTGAYFNENSFLPENNLDREILDMARRSYIAEFNSNNELIWCTYLDSSKADPNYQTYISDIDIDDQDNLLLTGYTTNREFPLLEKEGAYYADYDSLYIDDREDVFIMEFDSIGSLSWSTLYVSEQYPFGKKSWGSDIEKLVNGRIILVSMYTNEHYTQGEILGQNSVNVIIEEFDRDYKYIGLKTNMANVLYADFIYYIKPKITDILGLEKYDKYNDIERLYNIPRAATDVVYAPTGNLYISIGELNPNRFIEGLPLIQKDKTQFIQTNPPFSPAIMGISLCGSLDSLDSPFNDTLKCVKGEINYPLSVDSTDFANYDLSWYKNNIEVSTEDNYIITDEGAYSFVARNNVYTDCPSFYSGTLKIVYDTIDLNFGKDTVPLCVGDSIYVIDAYRFGASYLWSDSSTGSTYTVRYKGDSIIIVWCQVSNICGATTDKDSVIVRFYPPFAYLGEDTLLCKWQILNFDASILNKSIPAELEYKWFLNGEPVSGKGENDELFTITENDSGQLILHAIWPESGCQVGIDTLNFAYYQYDNVDFYIPEDTTICFYEDLEIDLIQTLEPNTDTNNIYLCLNSRGDTISTESNFILKEPLLYYISASNYCSKQEDTLKLNHFTDFEIGKLPTDTILCKGDSLNIDASILNKNIPDTVTLDYKWFLNGEAVPGSGVSNEQFIITDKDSGQLVLRVIWQESGCKLGIDTLNFSYYQYDNVYFDPLNDTSICFYEQLEIDLIANKTDNIDTNTIYLCLSNGDTISKKSSFILREALSYNISASNYCSKQEQTFKLSHFDNFNIEMLQPTDTTICKELFPTEISALTTEQIDGKCYWLSENKEDTIEIAPTRYIRKDGLYPITLIDIYNCSQDYEITVGIKEDCDPVIDIPNVFTPNSDGINDIFKIISAENVKDFEITIFNKAGTEVYDYKGLTDNFAWNGTYKNTSRDVPEGAYFFVIIYKDIYNTTRKQAGALTLLR